jgi:four helix bundle protein
MKQEDLENRLIEYAANIVELINLLPVSVAGNHLAKQLIRSGTAPALNYGEARGAESRNDFIHKNKVVLKELRESLITLKIINSVNLISNDNHLLNQLLNDSNELVSIFVVTLKTLGTKQ